MGLHVLCDVIFQIQKAPFFSIMVADISDLLDISISRYIRYL